MSIYDKLFPSSQTLEIHLAMSDDGLERFKIAHQLAVSANDDLTIAAATFYCQRCVIGTVDPETDQATISTVNVAAAHLKKLRSDPAIAERIRTIFGN